MKTFIVKLIQFCSILLITLVIGLFIPPTPRAKSSLLFSKNDKDALLKNVKYPRIILIGGSNLSFGINSKIIKDSLCMSPVNTGIQASLGLQYMMRETLPFIRKGDIIVISPEYNNFYNSFAYGSEVLCRMFFDVQLPNRKGSFAVECSKLSLKQWFNILPYYPKYVVSKLSLFEYLNFKRDVVYSRDSFNEFGDVDKHFELPAEKYLDLDSISGDFNFSIINEMKQFEKSLSEKGAKLFITFPGMEEKSYDNNNNQIDFLYKILLKNNFILLGSPKLFKFKRNKTFNGYCHLNKQGIEERTNLLIGELKKKL